MYNQHYDAVCRKRFEGTKVVAYLPPTTKCGNIFRWAETRPEEYDLAALIKQVKYYRGKRTQWHFIYMPSAFILPSTGTSVYEIIPKTLITRVGSRAELNQHTKLHGTPAILFPLMHSTK